MKNMYVVLVLAMLLTTSCINTKRIVYLEDMREDISYPMNAQPEMRIQRDDRLSIIVNSRNPELTVPFNISTGGDFQVTSNGDVSTTAGSQKQEKGYMVDLNGYIEFPILGKLKVVDLTRKQVARKCGVSEGYIKDVEEGRRIIQDDQARRILKTLGTSQRNEAEFSLDEIAATVDLGTLAPAKPAPQKAENGRQT